MNLLAASGVLIGAVAGGDIQIERIFGPEILGAYKHPAAIAELDHGDLVLAFFSGSGEYAADTAVHLSRKKKGDVRWSDPEPITKNPPRPEGNPVIWQAPDGKVWLFNVVRFGPTWCDSKSQARFSQDGGRTWSEPEFLSDEIGTMVRGNPIVLPNGDYLLGVYHETGGDREFTAPDTCSYFFVRDDKTGKWSETNRIRSRNGNLQPAAAIVEGNHLVAYCRRGGGYGPTRDGYLVRSESRDGGRTWSQGVDSAFPNPNAAIDFLRLANGHLLLVYNDSMTRRTPLTVAISTDGDRSYPHRRNLIGGDGDFGYPYAIQARDGKIHVVFTSDRRSTIRHAIFDESAILGRSKPSGN